MDKNDKTKKLNYMLKQKFIYFLKLLNALFYKFVKKEYILKN